MSVCSRISVAIITLLLPPLGVGIVTGCSDHLFISIMLIVLGALSLNFLVNLDLDGLQIIFLVIGVVLNIGARIHALLVVWDYLEGRCELKGVSSRKWRGGEMVRIEEGRARGDDGVREEEERRGEREKKEQEEKREQGETAGDIPGY